MSNNDNNNENDILKNVNQSDVKGSQELHLALANLMKDYMGFEGESGEGIDNGRALYRSEAATKTLVQLLAYTISIPIDTFIADDSQKEALAKETSDKVKSDLETLIMENIDFMKNAANGVGSKVTH